MNFSRQKISSSEYFTFVLRDLKLAYLLLTKKVDGLEITNNDYKPLLHLSLESRFYEGIITYDEEELYRKTKAKFIFELNHVNLKNPKARAAYAYKIIFDSHYNQLGHYFRHLYHILKFVYINEQKELAYIRERAQMKNYSHFETDCKENKKMFCDYASKVQAQMSAHELVVLFYNSLIYPKMEKLIYHYRFIRNIFIQDLIEVSHKEFYSGKTFDGVSFNKIEFRDTNREFNLDAEFN